MAWSRSLRLFASVCLCLGVAVECHLRPDGRGVCSRNTTTIMSYLSTGTLTSRIMYRITRITDYQCCLGWFESGDECPIFGCMNECLNGGSCISNNTCACMPGYTGGACENDLDECTSGQHWCEQGCSNTIGSFVCTCDPGYYLGDDRSTCVDIDECAVSNGNCSEICLNFIGAFRCDCRSGYALADDGYNCTDIDECLDGNGFCQMICRNTAGSYACACDPGFFLQTDNSTCADVNECNAANGGCAEFCTNTYGSYHCSCKPGTELEANNRLCKDIDECAVNNGGCGQNCKNTAGSFECACNPGYAMMFNSVTCLPCGGNYSALEGSLSSPGYPYVGFGTSEPCVWNISAPDVYNRVNLTCLSVRFNDVGTCDLGFVRVTSLPSSTRTWCSTPASPFFGGKSMLLEYFNNATGPDTGFHCHYAAAYKKTLIMTPARANVVSPNDAAGFYVNNANHTYVVQAASTSRICLEFLSFSLESTSDCSKDYVAVYDGELATAPQIGKFCGNSIPAKVNSSANGMVISFISDGDTVDRGFSGIYTAKSALNFVC
ncbi:fibrillin-1-like [Lethenteron reissneri]|uniref:fibrillin-1-like n=1 Tax=Lethenteron reissneri TaxID=7753 RepID=UPI002AB6AAA0|nr:fibrillin-1-like [Lethenteron reissneri]